MDLTIILPTFNEAGNIGILIDKIRGIFSSSSYSYEIIVVDAGSQDGTLAVVQEKRVRALVQQSPGYLYYNFSAYMDIIIGIGRFLGFQLSENFNRPFASHSF